MKRKIMSMAMAGSLMMLAGQNAFAAETVAVPDDGEYSISKDVESTLSVPTISVTLTDELSKGIVINPYRMDVDGDNKRDDAIVCSEGEIENSSDVALSLNVIASAVPSTEKSHVTIETSPLKGNETAKSIFPYLHVRNKPADKTGCDVIRADESQYDSKSDEYVTFGSKENPAVKKDMLLLPAPETGKSTYAAYKILGQVADSPAEAWTIYDTIKMNIVFQFKPVVGED